jgi:uncharacterized protein YraI
MYGKVRTVTGLVPVVSLLLAGCATASAPATTLTVPAVAVASVNGTGCPAGTVTTSVATDGSSVTASYSAFTAKAGAGSTPLEYRRACLLSIAIVAPGQTWAVSSATEHGAIDIPTGGSALQRTNYYIQGNSTGNPVDHVATGPQSGAWGQTDATPISAPCGTTHNLNVNVELRAFTAGGVAASLSLNGSTPGTTINLDYTAC